MSNLAVRLQVAGLDSSAAAGSDGVGPRLFAALRDEFSRFFEKLPDGYEDVDPETFKRLPVPY